MPVSSISIALERFTTFGDLLKYLRRRAGFTQLELSIAVGYSDAQISRLEQNERLPDLATLTARFLPVLQIDDLPEVSARLLELAAAVRREDAPAAGFPPYKGLYFFDEVDADLFFGREELTASLVERLMSGLEAGHRFLAIIGASGSGKSSVARAGMIPSLRWQQSSAGWPIFTLTPTTHPLEALAEIIQANSRSRQTNNKLTEDLSKNTQTLDLFLESAAKSAGTSHALLVVDQFEELFTLCRNETEQFTFIKNLLTAAFPPSGVGIVIIIMRADFYAHCARFDALRQALATHQEYIGPMDSSSLRRAIEEPAKRGHWDIESGLVDLFLHDIGADTGHSPEPGALPLLSHALLETWKRRRGHQLTLNGYTAAGGVRGAIAETAESVVYDQLAPDQREIARQIFLRLTELGDDTSTADTRRKANFDELIQKDDERELIREVLTKLADARLIITDQNTAEVAHEALIREWPTLRNWLEEDRESLRLHRHLIESAREWDASGRDPGRLYRGSRLAHMIEWDKVHPEEFNELERTFINESLRLAEREAAEREEQHQRELDAARQLAESERVRAEEQTCANLRLRKRAFYLSIALILAGFLAITSGVFWQRAVQVGNLATSRELAAASVNNLQIDPERSVLLALKALDTKNTLEARNALHQAFPELHLLLTIAAGHDGGAPGIAYSPDGNHIASVGAFGDVKIWDAANGNLIFYLPSEENEIGYSVSFSPDGKFLAAALKTGVIFINPADGQKKFKLEGNLEGAPNNEVVHITFSPDSRYLTIANMEGVPQIWDLTTQTKTISLMGHKSPCDGVAYSPDGDLLATSDDTGVIKIWETSSGKELFSLTHSGNVHSIAFNPAGIKLASASENGTIKIWDITTHKELLNLIGTAGFYGVAFLPDGKRLVASGQDGTAKVWSAETGQQLLNLAGNTSTVISVATSPDGNHVATSGYDGTLKIWGTAPGYELNTLSIHTAAVWDIAYSPDGKLLASVSEDGAAKLVDTATNQPVQRFSPGESLSNLTFSPDGKQIAFGSAAGKVYLWEVKTSRLVSTLEGHTYLVFDLSFSPDGTCLVTSSWDGTARLWNMATNKEIFTIPDQWSGVTFSPDGKSVFTGGLDRFVHQWDFSTGNELQKFSDGKQDVYGVAVSPDGNLLAVGNQDGTIVLWNVKSGNKVRTLSGHAGLVPRLAFSRDGKQLATASFDRSAKVWDVATGEESFSLYGNTGNVFGVSISPDGSHLGTAGADGTVRIYMLSLTDLITAAHSRVTRNLTADECQKYLHQSCP